MSEHHSPQRRGFVRLCAATVAALGASPALLGQSLRGFHRYARVRLVDRDGEPVRCEKLPPGKSFIFNYPYATTPCFLLNLGKPAPGGTILKTKDGRVYRWEGGIGPRRSVVAFSAICTHQMSYPAPEVSFINYRPKMVHFYDKHKDPVERAQVIYCCSQKSVYDPAEGARVLGGPAPQPLAAIQLEREPTDGSVHASGTWGGEMFEPFFAQNNFRLKLEYGVDDPRTPVQGTATVVPSTSYSRERILC